MAITSGEEKIHLQELPELRNKMDLKKQNEIKKQNETGCVQSAMAIDNPFIFLN